jgi:hypothetical protein
MDEELHMSDEIDNRGEVSNLKRYGAPAIIFASAILLLGVAWLLWATDDVKAQGAAITLIGVVAGHLVKEVQQLMKSWLESK